MKQPQLDRPQGHIEGLKLAADRLRKKLSLTEKSQFFSDNGKPMSDADQAKARKIATDKIKSQLDAVLNDIKIHEELAPA